MKNTFLNMNLQMFAESDEVDESVVDDQAVDESEVDEQIDEEVDESQEEEQVEEQPKQSAHVPLNKYMAEKRKRQELERMLSQQEADRKELSTVQQYLERGYPEFEAKNLAKRDVTNDRELESLKSRFQDTEVRDLARSGDFYSDAETFTDEIKDKMKTLNISAKDAYMLIRGETRTHEVQTKKEQRSAAQRKANSKAPATAQSTAPKTAYKLDDDDKKALTALQRMNPDAGWSVEKYYKLMKT
jgi:hypothetical protein